MDERLKVNWVELLDPLSRQIHPLLFSEMSANYPMKYYWTCSESEWAMDLMFRDPEQLRRMAPTLMRLGIVSFSRPDVLRFMGKQVSRRGGPLGQALPLTSDLKIRPNGARVKHRLGPNSIKIYDKAYHRLGASSDPRSPSRRPNISKCSVRLKTPHRNSLGVRCGRPPPMSTTVRKCRGRSWIDIVRPSPPSMTVQPWKSLTVNIEKRVHWKGRSVRALHPFQPQSHILPRAINRGEFQINGFRNRDLQNLLYSTPPRNKQERRSRSGAVSRKLRLLRAHGLIRKRQKSYSYEVAPDARPILNAILLAHQVTINKLLSLAA